MGMMALLDISSGHLRQKTLDWLDDDVKIECEERPGRPIHGWMATSARSGVFAVPFDQGWFVHVREPVGEGGQVPPDLAWALLYAHREGFDWIKFGADGERFANLPFYE